MNNYCLKRFHCSENPDIFHWVHGSYFPVFSLCGWTGENLQRCPTTVARPSASYPMRRWFMLWQVQWWVALFLIYLFFYGGWGIILLIAGYHGVEETTLSWTMVLDVVFSGVSMDVNVAVHCLFRGVWQLWPSSFLWTRPKADSRVSWGALSSWTEVTW